MSDNSIQETSTVECTVCHRKLVRKQKGKFPSKNKRWIDNHGKQWVGHKCPDCVRDAAKNRMRLKRSGDR